ncbi:MAG: hypothetical protein JJ895_06385 [Balneolaceae bacterium]|nr:hypothetical protein [Balneolaceae bacterium]
MSSQKSIFWIVAKLSVVIPMLFVITFPFGDVEITPNTTYSDITLYPQDLIPEGESLKSLEQVHTLYFTKDRELFTGTQTEYFKKSDMPKSSITFKNGIRIQLKNYDIDGNVKERIDDIIDFDQRLIKSTSIYQNEYLQRETIHLPPVHSGNHVFQEWYPFGQLQSYYEHYENNDSTIMIRYDIRGNVSWHEIYGRNGIEKIK